MIKVQSDIVVNNLRLKIASVIMVAVILTASWCIAVYTDQSSDEGNNDGQFDIKNYITSESFEISQEEFGVTYDEIQSFFDENSNGVLEIFLDENGNADYDFLETVDSGKNGVVELWNGWRVYLSSEVISGMLLAADAITYVAALFPVSDVVALALKIISGIMLAVNGILWGINLYNSDAYNGFYFDITYKGTTKVWIFTFTYYYPPSITNIGLQ